ncbi:dynein regulatory complex protein 10-like [Tubulanus polymorphus]|uniref:dynein regulatory complex protein 10-like n=1 Tax=Tubulanus polymorphus TaxID=672921 RepID=UPI003DA32FE1
MATEVAQMETLQMKMPNRGFVSSNVPRNANNLNKKEKFKMDPLRALEPARKKLSSVESQRVIAVLEDTMKRIELLTILPQITEQVDRFSIVFGSELTGYLKEHKIMKDSFDEVTQKLEKLRDTPAPEDDEPYDFEEDFYTRPRSKPSTMSAVSGVSHKESETSTVRSGSAASSTGSQIENLDRTQQFLAEQINFSVRSILRGFANNPAALTAVKNEFTHRPRTVRNLLHALGEMKDIMMGRLLTTPLEAQEKMQYLTMITQQERQSSVLIEKLEAELNSALADKDQEIHKRNDVIRKLQADLHQIEKFSEEHIRRTKSEAEKQESSDIKSSEGKRQKMTADNTQLKTQLQNLISEHRENESELRKRKYKIETEVENWIQKFDQDMGERQDEIERVDAIYTEEKKQLHELEERFKTLEEEYNQIMEERRIAQEKREEAEREMQLMIQAATVVQAFWRSFKVRKALKGKKKKGKGGKGKGKKGKKK